MPALAAPCCDPEPSQQDIAAARRAVLESTYPGWKILHLATSDRWYANRLPALTPAQVAAGVVATFIRGTYEEFSSYLAAQAGLVDRVGGFNS